MTFDELLDRCKGQARKEDALVPVLDSDLLLFAAVWPRVPITRKPGDADGDTWAALWACVDVDVAALAELVDVPLPKAIRTLNRMKSLWLVFPDGSVHELVQKLVLQRVAEALATGKK